MSEENNDQQPRPRIIRWRAIAKYLDMNEATLKVYARGAGHEGHPIRRIIRTDPTNQLAFAFVDELEAYLDGAVTADVEPPPVLNRGLGAGRAR